MQYKKNGGSPNVVDTMGDIRLSTFSGGSDGTTVSVLRQFGHKKQFRAHLQSKSRTSADCWPLSARRERKTERKGVGHFTKPPTYLFFSARTLALGTSNRQFGQ